MSETPAPILEASQRQQDFSIFEQHRSKFRELYLEQNKSREQVKEEMEKRYEFPETNLKDYEYGLRRLGFIKKLPIKGWIEVDICAKKRKEREGKETVVYLSGVQHSWDKIKRRISRHKKEEHVRKRICRGPTPDWPLGVVLKTPPLSPRIMINASQHNDTQITTSPLASHPIGIIPHAISQLQQLPEELWDRMRSNPNSSVHWLPEVPSIQLVRMFTQVANMGPSLFRDGEPYEIDAFNFSGDSTHAHCISPTFRLRQEPYKNSTQVTSITQNQLHFMEALSKLSTILANGNDLEIPDAREMLEWIGMGANKQVLKMFFALDLPTVAAVWSRLIQLTRAFESGDAFRTLVEVGFETHNRDWVRQYSDLLIDTMVALGSKKVGEIAQRILSIGSPYGISFFDMDHWLRDVIKRIDIELLSKFVDVGFRFKYDGRHKTTTFMCGICSSSHPHTIRDSFYRTPLSQRQQLIELVGKAGFDFNHLPGRHLAIDNVYVGVDELSDGIFREHNFGTPCSLLDNFWLSGDYEFYEAAVTHSEKTRIQTTISGLIIAASSGLAQLQRYLNSRPIDKYVSREVLLETALSLAAGLGNTAAVRSFSEAKVDPNARALLSLSGIRRFESDWHPLMRAAGRKHLVVVRLLIDMGAELRFDNVSFNPLSAAVWNSKPLPLSEGERLEQRETVKYFLAKDFPRAFVVDAIIMAVTRRHDSNCFVPDEEIIDMLLEAGVGLSGISVRGKDLLCHAIDQGCTLNTVEFLLSRGAQIHSGPCNGERTMLHNAAASSSIDGQQIVQLLLRNGASCTEEWGGPTVLELVLPLLEDYPNNLEATRRLQLFCFLLEKGAKVNGPEILARLLYYNAPDELISQAVQAGARVNPPLLTNGIKYTPLQLAIWVGRLDVARWLISLGADINSPKNGLTALQAACSADRGRKISMDFIQFLLDNGADINAPASQGFSATALQAALVRDRGGEIDMGLIQFLIDNGADVNATACRGGVTALQDAIATGSMSAFCLLLDAGANVHGTNYRHSSLDIAAQCGRLDMVDILLRKGAESYLQNDTPYDGAIELANMYGYSAIANILKKKLAERNQ
ncbi:ankyrin [Xylaria curta]|nr:ankyrin [Xylaria curta]